jgi:ubiquinone/menaquinone biosynthesis C-methylase UbiE
MKPARAEDIVRDFEQRIGSLQGLRILDAGSGNGGISIAFANHGAQVEGVDIEEELVTIARADATAQNSRANFTLYEGTTLPFLGHSFDVAFSASVIEHVTDPVRYLAEILRVLKPGGYLYLAFPNRLHPKETHTGLWGLSYLPLFLARLYVRMTRRNPLEDNNLHFYSYWDVCHFIHASFLDDRHWVIQDEKGKSTSALKRFAKGILHIFGIPHQAILPHVMLILKAS